MNATFAFGGDIDDGALLDMPSAVIPAERDVHGEIEDPEGFAAFGRPPDNDKPVSRD